MASDTVTWAHRLRNVGYDVVISGKQHFCGLDQLHGFRTQLARDLHAELWTKNGVPRGEGNWDAGVVEAKKPWGGIAQAGPGTTTEIQVDDQVEEAALCVYQRSRSQGTALVYQCGVYRTPFSACGAAAVLGYVSARSN